MQYNKNTIWFVLSLIAAVILLYVPFLDAPVYYDTRYLLLESNLRAWGERLSLLSILHEQRGLTITTFWLNWIWFGLEPFWLRLVNVVLHAFNSGMIFVFLQRLSNTQFQHVSPSILRWSAFVAALFFGLSPVAVYSVEFAIQRFSVLSLFFCLLSLLSFQQHLRSGMKRYAIVSVVSFLLAVQSKEHSVMFPCFLVLFSFGQERSFRRVIRQHGVWLFLLFLISLKVVLQARGILFQVYEPFADETLRSVQKNAVSAGSSAAMDLGAIYIQSVFNQMGLFFRYLYLWLFPDVSRMALVTPQPFYRNLSDLPAVMGVMAYLMLGGVSAVLFFRARSAAFRFIGFFVLCSWVLFWTEFSTVRFHENFLLYRSYVSMWCVVGLVFAFVMFVLTRFRSGVAVLMIAMMVVVQVLAAKDRLSKFLDPLAQWHDVVDKIDLEDRRIPAAYQAVGNLAAAYGEFKNYSESIRYYNLSAKLNPDYDKPWFGIGASLFFMNQVEEAVPYFKRAIKMNPLYKQAYYFLGMCLERLGQLKEANYQYELAIHLLSPEFEYESLVKFAETAIQLGQYAKADKAYVELFQKYPDRDGFRINYAINLYYLGRHVQALQQLQDIVRYGEVSAQVHLLLANLYLKNSSFDLALAQYQKVVEIEPTSVAGRHGVAMSYLSLGDVKSAVENLKKVFELDPEFAPSKQALEWIYKEMSKSQKSPSAIQNQ